MIASTRSQLRAATRTAHERLDQAVSSALEPWNARGYEAFLTATALLWNTLRPQIDTAANALKVPATSAELVAALEQDLAELGHARPRRETLSQPDATADWSIGCAYVLEGSALGARVLLQRLVTPTSVRQLPSHYLQRQSENGGRRFRDWIQSLEQREVKLATLSAGARFGFDLATQTYQQAFLAAASNGEQC